MIKRTLQALAVASCLTTFNVHAADALETAIGNIAVQADPAGVYKSRTRTTVTGGNFSARFGNTSFSLFSYTPPRISAGCGGISAHFGGFSFVNGIDFQQLVENVMQNALGLVVHLAIKVGCETCQDVLNDIQKFATEAAKWAVDSCRMAQSLVEGLNSNGKLCSVLASRTAANGDSEDGADALSQCNDEVASWDTYQDNLKKKEGTSGATATPAKKSVVCTTASDPAWCLLTRLKMVPGTSGTDPADSTTQVMTVKDINSMTDEEKRQLGWAELFRAIMPTNSTNNNTTEDETSPEKYQVADPTLFVKRIYEIAVCGVVPPTDAEMFGMLNGACANTWNNFSQLDIPVCDLSTQENRSKCVASKLDMQSWLFTRNFYSTKGMYQILAEKLQTIAGKFQTGTALDPTDEIPLIASAPIPLYQLFNLSTVYPSIQSHILGPSTILLADMLTTAYFQEKIAYMTRQVKAKDMPEDLMVQLRTAIKEFSVPIANRKFENFANDGSANERAFRNELLNNIKQYQDLLLKDIADAQMGANLSTSQFDAGLGIAPTP